MFTIYINHLLPILLKLQQCQPAQQSKEAKNIETFRAAKTLLSITNAAENNSSPKQPFSSSTSINNGQELIYLPLPLSTDLFKNAMLYVRQYIGCADKQSKNRPAVFIELETQNLARLWIGLELVQPNSLVIRIVVEKDTVHQTVKQTLPTIKKELIDCGYNNVTILSFVKPNVRCCQDIDPAADSAEVIAGLLDWEA